MSKHEELIEYILSLEVGTKISVRSIANRMNVSDGTAYRAIKECKRTGNVTTIPRVGTVRIEKIEKNSIETLTYGEIINVTESTILGGKDGIHKTVSKLVIGAMTKDAMKKYISPGCLLIVGNREEAQKLALTNEAGVLITGGFGCSDEIKKIANEKSLPIISSSYDTFTIASLINKALSESMIKKEIIYVEDIMVTKPVYININDTAESLDKLIEKTNYQSYPVVDNEMKVLGILTKKAYLQDFNKTESISKIMVRDPITVTAKATVAYAANIMAWEDIELCPVVQGKKLVGIVTRQDVIRTLQYASMQPQIGENLEDLILKNFKRIHDDKGVCYFGKIIPEMLDPLGTASWSSLNMLLSTIGLIALRGKNNINISVDSISTYFMKPVQIDNMVYIRARVLEIGRSFCNVEVNMIDDRKELTAKVLMSAKILIK